MAEEGGAFHNPFYDSDIDEEITNQLDDDFLVDSDDNDEQEVNTTGRIQLGEVWTPLPRGRTNRNANDEHEKSGLPETSYAETSFGGATTEDIGKRLEDLSVFNRFLNRNRDTGLIDTTDINTRENPLSNEDKAKEIQKL